MHTVGCPRTCLGFTNMTSFLLSGIVFIVCTWCVFSTDFFKAVNYTIIRSPKVAAVADFVNLKLWITPLTSILIPLSAIGLLTSCCGILGSGCKVKCAIKSYIFFVTVLTSIFFWIIFVTFIFNIYNNSPKTKLWLRNTIHDYYGAENDLITVIWNYIMVKYECCGCTDFFDFNTSPWRKDVRNKPYAFPKQCCVLNRTSLEPLNVNCPRNQCPATSYHVSGCFDALRRSIVNSSLWITFWMLLIGAFYVTVVVFAYAILRGEPLLKVVAPGFSALPTKSDLEVVQVQSITSLQNMALEEPPQKVVRVVSAIDPSRMYHYAPSAPSVGRFSIPNLPQNQRHTFYR